jgi:hypothetical protein
MATVVDHLAFWNPQQIAAAVSRMWQLQDGELLPAVDENGYEVTCPISLAPMTSPVLLTDGGIYEEGEIQVWLRSNDRSPCTNLVLTSKRYLRLLPFKEIVSTFLSCSDRTRSSSPSAALQSIIENASCMDTRPHIRLTELEEGIAVAAMEVETLHEQLAAAHTAAVDLRKAIDVERLAAVRHVRAIWKRWQAQDHVKALRQQDEGVQTLQGVARCFFARLQIKRLMHIKCQMDSLELKACLLIQRFWRSRRRMLAKRNKRRRLKEKKRHQALQALAVVTIQKVWTTYKSRRCEEVQEWQNAVTETSRLEEDQHQTEVGLPIRTADRIGGLLDTHAILCDMYGIWRTDPQSHICKSRKATEQHMFPICTNFCGHGNER